jgi:hypothetical protein
MVGTPSFSLEWRIADWDAFFGTSEDGSCSPWGDRGWWHRDDSTRGLLTVERFVIHVDVGSEEVQATFERILAELPKWWENFKAWLEIVAAVDVTTVPEDHVVGNELAWTSPVEPGQAPVRLDPPHTIVKVAPSKDGGKADDVAIAAGLAGSFTPPLCWQLIRGSRQQRWQHQWRASVLEAGTAAELALTMLIDSYLANAPAAARQALLDSYRTLGNRARLFRRLGGRLPSDFESLVRSRNMAAHEGAILSGAEATAAEEMAKQVVEVAEPLPSQVI